jgi:hypothetical protein
LFPGIPFTTAFSTTSNATTAIIKYTFEPNKNSFNESKFTRDPDGVS